MREKFKHAIQTSSSRRRFLFYLLFSACLSGQSSPASAQAFLYDQAGLPTGNAPSGIAIADFNGDGRPDIAVVNQKDNTVSVILTNTVGSFAHKTDYKVGNAPVALISADFNGDHVLDLAVVNSGDNTISILLGLGGGNFGSPSTYATGTAPMGVTAADFNSDSKVDLAVLNQADSTVSVFYGNGDGTFGVSPTTTVVVSNPIAIVSGDLNGDAVPDVAVVSATGSLTLLLNDGGGTFSAAALQAGSSAGGLITGDFNADGNLDLATTDPADEQLIVLLGNGSGGFQQQATSLSIAPLSIAAGDFNNDGKLDLAVGAGNNYPSSILLLLGNGDGSFQSPTQTGFTAFPVPIAVSDFNNDANLDLAALDDVDNLVTILLGDGKGHIGGHTDLKLPFSPGIAGSTIADFNGDGKIDFAVATFSQTAQSIDGSVLVVPGNGDGTFQLPISTQVPNIGIGQMAAGDFTGDGNIDLADSDSGFDISVVLGNGNGTFGAPIPDPVTISGLNAQGLVSGDFNNDGKTDLALLSTGCANACSPLYALISNGDGTFQPQHVYDIPDIALKLTVADFNHDGNLDIAVAGQVANEVFVLLGNGDGTFAGPTSLSTGTFFTYCVAAADFNGDGKEDLAVGTDQGILFYAGNGDGTFQTPVHTLTPIAVEGCVSGDFNGDGRPDLAFVGVAGMDAVSLGNGDGTFQAEVPFQPTSTGRTIFFPVADFNEDRSTDLVEFSSTGASMWISAPTPAFSSPGLNFNPKNTGTSSAPASIVVSNVGNAPLVISDVTATGNFTQTNNCSSPMAIGQTCSVNVTFSPAGNGPSSGILSLTDNARSGVQSLPLSGWSGPANFLMSTTPSTNTIAAGNSADYILTLTPGGGFSGAIQLTCTGAPTQASCTLSKPSVTLSGSSATNVKITVTTAAASATAGSSATKLRFGESWFFALLLSLAATYLFASEKRTLVRLAPMALALMLTSCGGGGSSGGSGGGGSTGTPPGAYQLTVTATGAAVKNSATLTLVVQ